MSVSEIAGINIDDIDFLSTQQFRCEAKDGRNDSFRLDQKRKALAVYLDARNGLLAEAPDHKRDAKVLFLNYQGTRITTRSIGRLIEVRERMRTGSQHQPALAKALSSYPLLSAGADLRAIRSARPRPAFDDPDIHSRVDRAIDAGLR